MVAFSPFYNIFNYCAIPIAIKYVLTSLSVANWFNFTKNHAVIFLAPLTDEGKKIISTEDD